MSHQYEIEIKSLLGKKDHADALLERLRAKYPNLHERAHEKQLNHYYVATGDFEKLQRSLNEYFNEEQNTRLGKAIQDGTSFSIRSREINGEAYFVLKASIDETTSENGIARIEFEEPVSISIEELDAKILDAGFEPQAKWSRERNTYAADGMNICFDKNAGYGYLVEFERLIDDSSDARAVRQEIINLMTELGVRELPQDRLKRMFAYYNDHWEEYYGTEKTFIID